MLSGDIDINDIPARSKKAITLTIPRYEKKEGIVERAVVFNFSQKDVANGDIRLAKGEPEKAKFKLIKLPQTTPD